MIYIYRERMLAGRSSLLRQNRILANRHRLSKTCNSRNDVVTMTRSPNNVELFHSGRMVLRKPTKSSISSKKRAKQVQQQSQQVPKEEVEFDPHAMASEMIQNSSTDGRIQGTEAIASMTPEQKMKNYATATTLVGFVTFVWWYSMQSVGRNTSTDSSDEDGIESRLREEAKDATNHANAKRISDEEVQELTQLDVTLDASDDDLIVAVAAPDDIATLEEDRNLGTTTSNATTHRPLWKKIVFFWKRDS